jgi:hypothetical protein
MVGESRLPLSPNESGMGKFFDKDNNPGHKSNYGLLPTFRGPFRVTTTNLSSVERSL